MYVRGVHIKDTEKKFAHRRVTRGAKKSTAELLERPFARLLFLKTTSDGFSLVGFLLEWALESRRAALAMASRWVCYDPAQGFLPVKEPS